MKACKVNKNIVLIYFLVVFGITCNISFAQLEDANDIIDNPQETLQNTDFLENETQESQEAQPANSNDNNFNPLAFFADNQSIIFTQSLESINDKFYSNHFSTDQDTVIYFDTTIQDISVDLVFDIFYSMPSIELGLYDSQTFEQVQSHTISDLNGTINFSNLQKELYLGFHVPAESILSIQDLTLLSKPETQLTTEPTQAVETTPEPSSTEEQSETLEEQVQEVIEQTTNPDTETEPTQAVETTPEPSSTEEQSETLEEQVQEVIEQTTNLDTETELTQAVETTPEPSATEEQTETLEEQVQEVIEQTTNLDTETEPTEAVETTPEPSATEEQSETLEEQVQEVIEQTTNPDTETEPTEAVETTPEPSATEEQTETLEEQVQEVIEQTTNLDTETERTQGVETTPDTETQTPQTETTLDTETERTQGVETTPDTETQEAVEQTPSSNTNSSTSNPDDSSNSSSNSNNSPTVDQNDNFSPNTNVRRVSTSSSSFVSNRSSFNSQSANQNLELASANTSNQNSSSESINALDQSQSNQDLSNSALESQVETDLKVDNTQKEDSSEKFSQALSQMNNQVTNDELFVNTNLNEHEFKKDKESIESSGSDYLSYIVEESEFTLVESDVQILASQSDLNPLFVAKPEVQKKPTPEIIAMAPDNPVSEQQKPDVQPNTSQEQSNSIINSEVKTVANQVANTQDFEFASFQASLIVKKPGATTDKALEINKKHEFDTLNDVFAKSDIQTLESGCKKSVCSPVNKFAEQNKPYLNEKNITLDLHPIEINPIYNSNFLLGGNSNFKNARVDLYLKRKNSDEKLGSKLTDSKGEFYFLINSNLVNNQNYTFFAEIKSQQSPFYKVITDFHEPELQYTPEKFCGKKLANSQLKCGISKVPSLEFSLPENKYLEVLYNSEVTPGELQSQNLEHLVVQPEQDYLETLANGSNHKIIYIVRDNLDPTKISSPVVVEFETFVPLINPITTPMFLFIALIIGSLTIEKIFFNLKTNDQPNLESLTEDL